MRTFSILLGFILVSATVAAKVRYNGYKIYTLLPLNDKHVEALLELEKLGVSFMHAPTPQTGREHNVVFAPHHQGHILEALLESGMDVQEKIEDVQKLIDDLTVNSEKLENGRLSWDRYYRLADIHEFIDAQAKAHPSFVETISIGKSYEGRDVKVIKISKSGETKPAIWIDSLIHAREWITGAVGTYIIDQLLYSTDLEIQSWLNDYDFYILPVFNPDGYEYTFTHDRFWRKTRSNTTSALGCKGVDGNRNFDFAWMENGGASADPCSMTYGGSKPFSEPETSSMAEFIETLKERLVFYLSLHSSGQYILIPRGSTNESIPQYGTYMRIGEAAAVAHRVRFNTIFIPGNIVNLMYVATGSSMDWVKEELKTNLTLTYELRDKGAYGHLLPPQQILPSALEFMDGLKVILRELAKGIPEVDPISDVDDSFEENISSAIKLPAVFDTEQTFGHVPNQRQVLSPMVGFRRF